MKLIGLDDIEPLMEEVNQRPGGFTDFLLIPRHLERADELQSLMRSIATGSPRPPSAEAVRLAPGDAADASRPMIFEQGLQYYLPDDQVPSELPPAASV